MELRSVTCALISSDAELRGQLAGSVGAEAGLEIVLEISEPIQRITAKVVENLLSLAPEIVLLDLDGAPAPGLKLAQYLIDADPSLRLILTGPEPSPDLLLATLRIGATEYLKKPVGPKDLMGSLDRIRKKLAPAPHAASSESAPAKTPAGLVHVFVGPRPGQGTTTVASSVACEIARITDSRVLFVDLDLEFGDADLHFGLVPEFDAVDLVRNLHRMDAEMLRSYAMEHESGVRCVLGSGDYDKASSLSPDQIGQLIRLLRRHCDHLVIDAGHPLGVAAAAVVERADTLTFVSRPTLPALRATRRLMPVIERMRGERETPVRLVLSAVRDGEALGEKELTEAVGVASFHELPHDSRSADRALHDGQPVALGKGPLRTAITALASKVLGVEDAGESAGVFGRLLRRRS